MTVTYRFLKTVLSTSNPKTLPDDGSKRGAVIIPIFQKPNGQLYVLFTKRSQNVSTHKGQISFPGGKKDETDVSLLDCAFRETLEEVGIPKEKLEVLGELDQIKTKSSNVLLSSYVCKLDYPFPLKVNTFEVDQIIEIPLTDLLKEHKWQKQDITLDNEKIPVWFFKYNSHTVWGATAQLLVRFAALIRQKQGN